MSLLATNNISGCVYEKLNEAISQDDMLYYSIISNLLLGDYLYMIYKSPCAVPIAIKFSKWRFMHIHVIYSFYG